MQAVERLLAEGGVVADALDAEQASVGREADRFQIVKVAQHPLHPEVAGVVDDGFRPQGASALVGLMTWECL